MMKINDPDPSTRVKVAKRIAYEHFEKMLKDKIREYEI
jgi:hypothetical protein